MAEIGADQALPRGAETALGQTQHRFNLNETLIKHSLGLPVPIRKIADNASVFLVRTIFGQRGNIFNQPQRPPAGRRG